MVNYRYAVWVVSAYLWKKLTKPKVESDLRKFLSDLEETAAG